MRLMGPGRLALVLLLACGESAPPLDAQGDGDGDPNGGALRAECDDPGAGWIWCDDFEADRFASYFEYDAADGAFVRVPGVGVDSSAGMRARWQTSQVGAGSLHLAFGATPDPYFEPVDAGTARYRELYWRVYVRNESGWTGGGADKLSRATILAADNWAQAMIAHVWSGSGDRATQLVIDPASGTDPEGNLITTRYNDFDNLRWLGSEASQLEVFGGASIGEWHCIEAHVRLNDAGQANGVFELWIDGRAEASRTGLNWVGAYDDFGINAVFVENYWNAGSPRQQERYIDNLVVSTNPIGCG